MTMDDYLEELLEEQNLDLDDDWGVDECADL
jgi:hypothetical protein